MFNKVTFTHLKALKLVAGDKIASSRSLSSKQKNVCLKDESLLPGCLEKQVAMSINDSCIFFFFFWWPIMLRFQSNSHDIIWCD